MSVNNRTTQSFFGLGLPPVTRTGQWCRRDVVLCLALLGLNPAWAQLQDEPYVPAVDPITSYLEAIDNAETIGGAYANELSDLYLGLGHALIEDLQYDAARDAFHQGVLISRVNNGPNSLEQANYLWSIAEIETRIGDARAASEVLEHIYLINAKNHGEDSPKMLPVLERMYDWYLEQRPLFSPMAMYDDFARTEYLAGRMAYLTEQEKGLGHPETAKIYRTLGQVHFMTVRYVLSRGISIEPGVVMSTGTPQPPQIQEVSIRDHFRAGTEAFERYAQAVGATEDVTALEYAEALAQYGDWYLVFQKYQSAREIYMQAYQVLVQTDGSNDLAEAYMGKPTPVRFMNNHEIFTGRDDDEELDEMLGEAALVGLEGPDEDAAAASGLSLDVSMTVTRSGDLRNIEILNAPESMSKEQIRRIERQLEVTRFRPGLLNGEVVKMEDFVWRYSGQTTRALK